MVDLVNTPTTLGSLVKIVNSKVDPKILQVDNYEVISIEPINSSITEHNTEAKIRVDLAKRNPTGIMVETDRYSTRVVRFTRIELKDIAAYRAIPKNLKGQYEVAVTDVASAITALGANIDPTEVDLVTVGDSKVLRAKPTSMGYVGNITFVAPAVVAPTTIAISSITTNPTELNLVVGGTSTVALTVLPVDTTETWTIVNETTGAVSTTKVNEGSLSVTALAEGVGFLYIQANGVTVATINVIVTAA